MARPPPRRPPPAVLTRQSFDRALRWPIGAHYGHNGWPIMDKYQLLMVSNGVERCTVSAAMA